MKDHQKKIIQFAFDMYRKYEALIKYGFFGVCTMIVNFIVHFSVLALTNNVYVATAVAWIVAVFFAYLTNRFLVFKSKERGFIPICLEISKFVGFRILSLGMEEMIMFLFIGIFGFNDVLVKAFGQFVVVVSNYIFSKLFIFNKKKVEEA